MLSVFKISPSFVIPFTLAVSASGFLGLLPGGISSGILSLPELDQLKIQANVLVPKNDSWLSIFGLFFYLYFELFIDIFAENVVCLSGQALQPI